MGELIPPDALVRDASTAAFVAFIGSAAVARRGTRALPLLPFVRAVWRAAGPVLGLAALAMLKLIAVLPARPSALAAGAAITAAVSALPKLARAPRRRARPQIRTVVIGSAAAAANLDDELRLAQIAGYVVVGRVDVNGGAQKRGRSRRVPALGSLGQLREVIIGHRVDLLVIASDVQRMPVFHEVAQSCMDLPVRLWEMSGVYEELLGHVPVSEITAAWFQYVMHPRYRQSDPWIKRALDISIAVPVVVLALPLIAMAALAVRRDGGPMLFSQERIGQGGRPFTLYKLRTMRPEAGGSAQWASHDDPRVTSVGRLLRRTHLDELPQLVNVLRGEMSLVGPRPEQREFVERLEHELEFYQRRHLIKPGITGWAQVRCGYARSDVGSAWKLCHDLYYLKHRSMRLDLMIMAETLRAVVVTGSPAAEPSTDRLQPAVAAFGPGRTRSGVG